MEDHSTLSVPGYLLEHLFYAVIVGVWLKAIGLPALVVPFVGISLGTVTSAYVLTGMTLVSVFVGLLLTIRRYRTTGHVLVHIVTPVGLYFLMVLRYYVPILALVQGVLIVAAFAVYLLLLCSDLSQEDRFEQLRRRFRGFPRRAWAFLSVVLIFSPGVFYVSSLTGNPLHLHRPKDAYGEELDRQLSQLSGLREGEWQRLSEAEQTALLKIVLEMESSYLGLEYVPVMEVENLDEDLAGSYVFGQDLIRINRSELLREDGWSALSTVCHEVYHAYQEMQVELYEKLDSPYRDMELLRDAAVYAQEFRNYQDGEGDYSNFSNYYDQQCETDARNYAEERSMYYYFYLTENGE